jgi:predicted GNAT family acetyltransferase
MHAETRCVDKNMKKCKNFADTSLEGYDDEMAWFTYETTEGEAHNFFTIAGKSGQNLVSPAVQVTYNELAEYKRKYGVWTADKTDSRIGTVAGREQFPGSAVSEAEAYGLWENDQKYDIKTRVTDFWRGRGVAYKVSDNGVVQKDKNWKYEVVVCDESSSVPFGFFVSGMDGNAKGCFKTCNNWCDDRVTDHYRAAWGGCFV